MLRLSDRVRRRLTEFLSDDRPDPGRFLGRLREIGALEDIPACSSALHLLAHLDEEEPEAERLLRRILDHRSRMKEGLGRDPGLRVAAADFLAAFERRLTSPTIIERAELEEAERSGSSDDLTGLGNRRAFREALERETRRGKRYGMTLSLLLIDVDGFEEINRVQGRASGDRLLGRAGRALKRTVREADVACRYGGDEFAVILPETDRLGALTVAERIRTEIARSFRRDLPAESLAAATISGGLACFPDDGRDSNALVSSAASALERAKRAGGDRVMIHHSERREDVRYPTKRTAAVRIGATGDEPPRAAVPINVSRSGLLVETDHPYWPLDRVRVLLSGEEWGMEPSGWSSVGRIARVEPVFQSPGRFRIGIAFERPVPDQCVASQAATARIGTARRESR